MKRILPAARTGIKPVQDSWVNEEDYNARDGAYETRCGCGLAIKAIDAGAMSWEELAELESKSVSGSHVIDEIADRLGVTGRYAVGFVEGFDGVPRYPGEVTSADEQQGYEDGIATCNLIFGSSHHARCTHTCKLCEQPIILIDGVWRDFSDGDFCESQHEPAEEH